MNETITIALSLGAGLLLGALFFGGLWWTVRQGLGSRHPALWFLGSFLLRTGLATGGLLLVSQGHLGRLIAGLSGFIVARLIITGTLGPHAPVGPATWKETPHAP